MANDFLNEFVACVGAALEAEDRSIIGGGLHSRTTLAPLTGYLARHPGRDEAMISTGTWFDGCGELPRPGRTRRASLSLIVF